MWSWSRSGHLLTASSIACRESLRRGRSNTRRRYRKIDVGFQADGHEASGLGYIAGSPGERIQFLRRTSQVPKLSAGTFKPERPSCRGESSAATLAILYQACFMPWQLDSGRVFASPFSEPGARPSIPSEFYPGGGVRIGIDHDLDAVLFASRRFWSFRSAIGIQSTATFFRAAASAPRRYRRHRHRGGATCVRWGG
jgi:hypothetical protein